MTDEYQAGAAMEMDDRRMAMDYIRQAPVDIVDPAPGKPGLAGPSGVLETRCLTRFAPGGKRASRPGSWVRTRSLSVSRRASSVVQTMSNFEPGPGTERV